MDTTNRPHSNLPARISSAESRLSLPFPPPVPVGGGSPGAATASVNPRTLLRGLIRHWWHILGLSIIFSLPILYAIFVTVVPKYKAMSILRIETSQPNLYNTDNGQGELSYAQNYLQTQINIISGQEVLTKVATNPKVSNLPLIKNSEDYYYDLHNALTVEAIPGTFLIRVSHESEDSEDAYIIVQAVIQTYMEKVTQYSRARNNALKKLLVSEASKIERDIDLATENLIKHAKKQNIQLVGNPSDAADGKEGGTSEQKLHADKVSENDYSKFRMEYIRIKLELDAEEKILEEKVLKKKQEEHGAVNADEAVDLEQTLADADLSRRIEAEFRADPEVRNVLNGIEEKEKEIKRVSKIARQGTDPALNWLRQELIALDRKFKKLWDQKYDAIRQQVVAQSATAAEPGALTSSMETLKETEQRVAELRARKVTLENHLNDLDIENKEARVDAINTEIAEQKLNILRQREVLIQNHLKQTTFEAENEQIRVSISDPVQKPMSPSQNKRIKLMAVTPIAVMFAFLGLFLILEIKAERVFDVDALSTRVQSEVFALPPLPSAREVRKMRELESGSDQIDRFIQRLDHLRFAVCGAQTPLDTGRCVLITSAVGGEGKTTLAAQLAARCGNAGMSTLLIDADMRRASLGTLLDVADGPGLSDVLKGDLTVEEGAVPVQGGAFHLLPAGTPIDNISLVLHGPNIGILIARLRELYDLIVIDSPPVLPVPDALILGQWVDGAILASRFDVSRFPQVERARRQLDNAGITVLGTVINGMRASDSYYGHYSYARKKGTEPNSSNAH